MPDNCKFSSGDVAKVDDDARLQAGGKDCTFEKGAVILLSYDAPEGDPAPVPTKEVPVNPVMTPAQAAPVRNEAAAPVTLPIPASEETPAPALQEAAPAAPAAEEVQAHTEVPAGPSADDISKAAAAAGDNPLLAFGLAALVVLGGGGAMWKSIQKRGEAKAELDQKRAEQEHELKLKELEIKSAQSASADYSATQPPPCHAATTKQEQAIASLRSELEELKGKVGKVEKKSMSFSSDFDADEIVERLEKAEKEVKALKAAKRAKAV